MTTQHIHEPQDAPAVFFYNAEFYNMTRSCILEGIAMLHGQRLVTAPIRLTITGIPLVAHIGPFVHTEDLQRAYLYAVEHAQNQFRISKKTSGKTLPEAFQYPSLQGSYWLVIRTTGSDFLDLDFYTLVHSYCKNTLSLSNTHLIRTDSNVGEAWTRLMAAYAMPGWCYNAPIVANESRYTQSWEKFVDTWVSNHFEFATLEISDIAPLRIAFIDMNIPYAGNSCTTTVYTAQWKDDNLIRLTPDAAAAPITLKQQFDCLKNAYAANTRAADLYVYMIHPGLLQTLSDDVTKMHTDAVHCELIHKWGASHLSTTATKCMHLVWPTEHRLKANNNGFVSNITRVRTDFNNWLYVGLLIARASGLSLPITLDPLEPRVLKITQGLLTRLFTTQNYSILPDKAFCDALSPHGPDAKVSGGIFTSVSPTLLLNSQILLVDVKSCYPTMIIMARLCLTGCKYWPKLHSILPSQAHAIGEQIFSEIQAKDANTETSEPLPPLCAFLQNCLTLRDKYRSSPLYLALKLLVNGLYGLMASPVFRYYTPIIAAITTDLARRVLRILPTGFEHIGVPVNLIMCATDSMFVEVTTPKANLQKIQDDFCQWLTHRFRCIRVEFNVYTSLLISHINSYAALNCNDPNAKVQVRGRERDCPPAFTQILDKFLFALLSHPDPISHTSTSFETTFTQWLTTAAIPLCPPSTTPINHNYYVTMSQGRCRQCRVRSNKSIFAPIIGVDPLDNTGYFIPQQPTQQNSGHISVAAWKEWYLHRYIFTNLCSLLKVWPLHIIERLIASHCDLKIVPSKISAPPTLYDTTYWDIVTQKAGASLEVLTPSEWQMQITCDSCKAIGFYNPLDDTSCTEWKRRSQSGESVFCSTCEKPLRSGGFQHETDDSFVTLKINSAMQHNWGKSFDNLNVNLNVIAHLTDNHPEQFPSLFTKVDSSTMDVLAVGAHTAASHIQSLIFHSNKSL